MNIKHLGLLALMLVMASIFSGAASAADVPVYVKEVKIDGTFIRPYDVNRLGIERGDEIEVKVVLTSLGSAANVQVEAEIKGYEYDDKEQTSDITHTFDVEPNVTYVKTLNVPVPSRIEEDSYKLRITITDRDNDEITLNYNLKIDAPRHELVIRDIVLTPEDEITAGRALLATVRVKNMGDRDEDSVKVTVSIPSLGLSASDYIDEVESGDSETSQELYLRIPACAEAGDYDVVAEVEYDDGYEDASKTASITVQESDVCEASAAASSSEPEVVIGSALENIAAGEGGAIYPITITNKASASRTYSVTVDGLNDWGTAKISPTSTIVVGAGKTESFYVFVAANADAAAGQQVFTATVKQGSNTVKQAALTANIVEPQGSGWGNARKGLEIAVVVLAGLLVILALAIGFSRLKGEEKEDSDKETETYY